MRNKFSFLPSFLSEYSATSLGTVWMHIGGMRNEIYPKVENVFLQYTISSNVSLGQSIIR